MSALTTLQIFSINIMSPNSAFQKDLVVVEVLYSDKKLHHNQSILMIQYRMTFMKVT